MTSSIRNLVEAGRTSPETRLKPMRTRPRRRSPFLGEMSSQSSGSTTRIRSLRGSLGAVFSSLRSAIARSSDRLQEPGDRLAEPIQIHEEGIVALDRRQPRHLDFSPQPPQDRGDLLLLIDRKEEIGLDPDHERPSRLDPREPRLDGAPDLRDVEEVHRP